MDNGCHHPHTQHLARYVVVGSRFRTPRAPEHTFFHLILLFNIIIIMNFVRERNGQSRPPNMHFRLLNMFRIGMW